MKILNTKFQGLKIIQGKNHYDSRGYLREVFRNNFSNNKRRMIFLTYNKKIYGDHRLEHFADKRRNFPPNIEREKGKKYIFHI